MKRLVDLTFLVLGLVNLSCGGGGGGDGNKDPVGPGNGGQTSWMRAKIDNVSWASTITYAGTVSATPTPDGTVQVFGVDANGITISLLLSYISAPGTFPMGVFFQTNAGGFGEIDDINGPLRITPLSAAAGTVTITRRTSTRIAGNFQFTATADSVLTTHFGEPDMAITGGEFDITMPGGIGPLPTGSPSSMQATIGGFAWSAATVWGSYDILPNGQFSGLNTKYAVDLQAKVPLNVGGVYDIGSQFDAVIVGLNPDSVWSTTVEDSVGQVTILSIDSERVEGTFYAAISPLGNAGPPVLIENGSFSVHVPDVPAAGEAVALLVPQAQMLHLRLSLSESRNFRLAHGIGRTIRPY